MFGCSLPLQSRVADLRADRRHACRRRSPVPAPDRPPPFRRIHMRFGARAWEMGVVVEPELWHRSHERWNAAAAR